MRCRPKPWVEGPFGQPDPLTTSQAIEIEDKFRKSRSLENLQLGVFPKDASPEKEKEKRFDWNFFEVPQLGMYQVPVDQHPEQLKSDHPQGPAK
ncbi:hypothetical protein ACH5RR_018612 [Cinchona calisaya]|uniref:Uncharacterized protein n=1 Tax=Cinchona calisaya TaxID=153742 RepID=A0ABD2ZN73_9GENT